MLRRILRLSSSFVLEFCYLWVVSATGQGNKSGGHKCCCGSLPNITNSLAFQLSFLQTKLASCPFYLSPRNLCGLWGCFFFLIHFHILTWRSSWLFTSKNDILICFLGEWATLVKKREIDPPSSSAHCNSLHHPGALLSRLFPAFWKVYCRASLFLKVHWH